MKVELMKQNKNTPVVRVASAALAAFVLFFSLCIPSFADSSYTLESFIIPVGSSTDSNTIASLGCYAGDLKGNTSAYIPTYYENYNGGTSFYQPIYVFGVYGSSASTIYFVSNQQDGVTATTTIRIGKVGYSSTYFSYNGGANTILYNGSLYHYSSSSQGVLKSGSSPSIPSFSSFEDGIAALDAVIGSSSVSSHPLSTSLPAGNAIIIDISGNSGEVLSLSSSSALRHKSPWSDGNQTMNYTDSAPASISTPYGSVISWTGSGNPNLFGGYNTWILNGPLNPTKNYLVIVNPAYPNDNPDSITSNQASNGPIHISCAYCKGYTFVPLSSYWDNGSIANESGTTRLDGEYDESTQSWVTKNPSTGEPQNPVSGGMTDVDAEHITINDWLQNISHQIGSFFSGAIGAVSNLVGAGSDFIQSLSSLYSWLPGPVYAVLSSALILVITIGVIKVFI